MNPSSTAPASTPLSAAYRERFNGIARLYGESVLQRFQKSCVCIIGIGGVGSWAAEALARSGIGRLVLIDMDEVCVTNTNRQLHALNGNYGKPKIEAMRQRLLAINPEIQVDARLDFLTPSNLLAHITPEIDVIIDAIDSIKPKTALMNYCRRNKRKVITIGGAGGQTDPTRIAVSDLSTTEQDPLLAKLRRELRTHFGFPRVGKGKFGIEAVYSNEPVQYPVACTIDGQPQAVKLDCSGGLGASTCVTSTFGMVAASRTLAILAKQAAR
ncbi:Molybdopterin biosynthesis MoeB protein [gamma proteobacterium HdN1]|nr:Molybdopterin biosynthesis MoeB protein [gamma proteobacterium HdN1]